MNSLLFFLFLFKFTSSYSLYNINNKFIYHNGKSLNIYSYVSNDPHSENVLQDVNRDVQLVRNRRQNHQINDIRIITMDSKNEHNLRSFGYELSDGTKREEEIRIIDQIDDNGEVHRAPSVMGLVQYISKEGYLVHTQYTADNKGYVAKVLFGKNVMTPKVEEIKRVYPSGGYHYSSPAKDLAAPSPPQSKGVGDADLICSLIGSGCL